MAERAALLGDGDVSMFSGSSTLFREMLKSCAKEGGSTIPSNWTTNVVRTEMELRGWLKSERVDPFRVRWTITDAGRTALAVGSVSTPEVKP